MIFSTSAFRRYTPPTCTLKIIGKTSPLSRWGARPLFKTARFELSFDDPRQLAEEQIAIAGDRFQLERLYEVVSNYVQTFLMESAPARWPARSAYPLYPPSETSAAAAPTAATLVVPPDSPETAFPSPASPSLTPKGLLKHYLAFGDLATPQSGDGIALSATQLFDLATALDDYNADVAVLPELDETRAPKVAVMPWATAVAGAVLAIGATTAAILLQNRSTAPTTASSEPQQQVAIAPSPAIEPLPAPPATGLPVPSPTLPSPLGQLERVVPPQPTVSPNARSTSPGAPTPVPSIAQPAPATGSGIGSGSTTTVLRPNANRNQQSAPQPQNSRPRESQVAARPAPPVTTPYPPLISPNRPMPEPSLAPKASPVIPVFPPSAAPDIPTAPTPSLPTFPPLAGDARTTASAPETGDLAAARQREVARTENAPGTTSPQRAEVRVEGVRNYFQQRWQAPKDLTEPLQYSLVLKKDGTIERIIPYGKVSGIYLDRTAMPQLGENFGIAQSDSTTQVRLQLNPDGSVEAKVE